MKRLKIFHCADFQAEARPTDQGDRYDEFKVGLKALQTAIVNENPDYVIIAGDLFQYHLANGTEIDLVTEFLTAIKRYRVIIIPGNHDIRQKNVSITMESKKSHLKDPIEPIVKALDTRNVVYLKNTGFYKDADFTWAVWSQYAKFAENDDMPYSPWELDDAVDDLSDVIELYHDPIPICRGFDGEESTYFKNTTNIDKFKAKLVLAGDIHAPGVYGLPNGGQFVYCSSAIMRNYGEGDYWKNDQLRIDGMSQHGYMIHTIDKGDSDYSVKSEFIQIEQTVSRSTIDIDEKFLWPEMIKNIRIKPSKHNYIRLRINANLAEYFEYEDQVYEYLKDVYNATVHTEYDSNVLLSSSDDDTEMFDSINEFMSKSTIIELARTYATKSIASAKSIPSDQKDKAVEQLMSIFEAELDKIELTVEKNHLQIDSAIITNFMAFGDDVEIDFNQPGINRVGGTNGVGKTMIRNFLRWMFRDAPVPGMSGNKKRENRLYCFNDYRSKDEVNGVVKFRFNGVPHVLTKELTRKWKRDKNMHKEDDWRKYITEVPRLHMTLETPDELIDNQERIFAILDGILTDNEFDTLISIERDTIRKLLHQDSNELNNSILKNIGLHVFDQLAKQAPIATQNYLSTIKNPGDITVKQLMTDIDEVNQSVEQAQIELGRLTEELQQSTQQKERFQQSVIRQTEKLHNVGTVLECQQLVDDNILLRNNLTLRQSEVTDEINRLQEDQQSTDMDVLLANVKLATEKSSKSSMIVEDFEQKTIDSQQKVDVAKDNVKTNAASVLKLLQSAIVAKQNEQLQLESKQSVLKQCINDEKESIQTIIDEQKSKVQAELNSVSEQLQDIVDLDTADNHSINNKMLQKTSNDKMIETYANDIDDLQASKSCPACKREYDSTTVNAIADKITQTQKSLRKYENDNNMLDESILISKKAIELRDEERTRLTALKASLKSKVDHFNIEPGLVQTEIDNIKKFNEQINELDNNKAELHEEELRLTSNLKSDVAKHDMVVAAMKAHQLAAESHQQLLDSKQKLVDDAEKDKLALSFAEQQLSTYRSLSDVIAEKQTEVLNMSHELKAALLAHSKLEQDVKHAKSNVAIKESIQVAKDLLAEQIEEHDSLVLKKASTKSIIDNADIKIEEIRKKIEHVKRWNIASSVCNHYSQMLSKKGLPRYVFAKVTDILNKQLNEMLGSLRFRLVFDKSSLTLKFVDLDKRTTRPVMFVSGMQTIMAGLALIQTRAKMNQSKSVNFIFIDEISGVLNDGKDVSYEADNFKKLMSDLLQVIARTTSIYIVDHVIENLNENRILEVYPTSDGSNIKMIEHRHVQYVQS